MPQVTCTAQAAVTRPDVWAFVQDMNHWAPLLGGYQQHQVLGDRESVWTLKGDLGPLTRTTKFRVQITEWVAGERVAFSLSGVNEPLQGQGAIRLTEAGTGTEICAELQLSFTGALGPLINRLLEPLLQPMVAALVTGIVSRLESSPETGC